MGMPPQPPLLGMDPAQNNMPLQFNTNKGKPMIMEGDGSDMMESNISNIPSRNMAGPGSMIGPVKPGIGKMNIIITNI